MLTLTYSQDNQPWFVWAYVESLHLEADYLRFLAKVQKAAKDNPVDAEFDFP